MSDQLTSIPSDDPAPLPLSASEDCRGVEARALTKRLGGMLVGLSEPDSGKAPILGGRYRDLPNPGRRVGVLLDASAQHAGRRGRKALAVSAHIMGVPARRVDALLKRVGLDEAAARRRVDKYSLGMRQRLGLAHVLVGDPEVQILDEPANGLDPEGMRWLAGLLRDFADRGGTVLLSSHLLAEVEAVADRMIIIGGGRIQAQGARRVADRDRTPSSRRTTSPRSTPCSTWPA